MLILTRKIGEVIVIGDNIKVCVTDIVGGKVRIGIEADPSIHVHRGEVWDRISEVRKPE